MTYPPEGQQPNGQPQYPGYQEQGLPPYQQPGYQQSGYQQPGYQQTYPAQPGYPQAPQPYGVMYAAPTAYQQVPPGTSSFTVWSWINAALPLAMLVAMFVMPWREFFEATTYAALDPWGTSEFFEEAFGRIAGFYGISLAVYAVGVITAALDHGQLRKLGIDRPFHWAWAFLGGPVLYGIGRAVVIRRRGASGMAGPLTLMIVVTLVAWIGSSVWMMQSFPWEIMRYGY